MVEKPGRNAADTAKREAIEAEIVATGMTPLEFLTGVMHGSIVCTPDQLRAAIAAAQYVHVKRADGGKKDELAEAAKKASAKFKTSKPPLKLVNA